MELSIPIERNTRLSFSYLKQLLSILIEFDIKYTLIKNILGRYFYKNLRPLIKLWIDKKDQELNGWDILVKKKAKFEVRGRI